MRITKENRTQIFTVIVLLLFVGSSLAFAISSAFSEKTNLTGEAKIILNILGGKEEFNTHTEKDLKLGQIMKDNGYFFNLTCIDENCDGQGGAIYMWVNGNVNKFMNDYIPQNNDLIVIAFVDD